MTKKTQTSLEAQKAYVTAKTRDPNFRFGLMVGEAFIRGIRDIGYKHTGAALAELVDNSFQSGAEHIHVAFDKNKSGPKATVTALAVIDDGPGMIPDMIRFSTMWGGTHRENDREGFGRYGYGLPSASVSMGKRFTVYSLPEGERLHSVTLDVDAISRQDKEYFSDGEVMVPEATPAKLPKFVEDHITAQLPGGKLTHGTVVVIENLDKLTNTSVNGLRNHLLEFFGITYQKLLRNAQIVVEDTVLEPIDPLFITPGFRYYALDGDRAQPLDPIQIEVKSEDGKEVKGVMEVRFSYMPPAFGSIDKTKGAERKNQNPRFPIMKEYNGIIFYRMGRFLDCVRHTPFHTFVNYDRYYKIEVDFPAVLDEYFNVSTSKQRVDVSDKIWDKLKEAGMVKAIATLAGKAKAERNEMAAKADKGETDSKRPSEEAMEETAKVLRQPNPEVRRRQEERGEAEIKKLAQKRAVDTGQPTAQAEEQLRLELKGQRYKVAHENMPGGPFFRVYQLGGTMVLALNTAHRFYSDLYAGASTTPATRAALEVLLFSIGECIDSAPDQVRAMYDLEVPEWSRRLEHALLQLSRRVEHDDGEAGDAVAEAA